MGTAKRARQKANRQARLEAAVEAQQKAKTRRRYLGFVLVAVAFLGGAFLINRLAGNGGDDATDAATPTTAVDGSATTAAPAGFAYGVAACPAAGAEKTTTFAAAPKLCIDPAKAYTAVFDTTAGSITVQLDTARTPGTVNNFVVLAGWRYYENSQFFRTDPSIGIIQGGGKSNKDTPGYTIPDEGSGYTYEPGQLVMARTAAPNSAGGQFFFTVDSKASALNGQGTYVPFGTVTSGLDVLQKILASHVAEAGNPLGGSPDPAVIVRSVTVTER